MNGWLNMFLQDSMDGLLERYMDLGVYRWGKLDPMVESEGWGLWFPSGGQLSN